MVAICLTALAHNSRLTYTRNGGGIEYSSSTSFNVAYTQCVLAGALGGYGIWAKEMQLDAPPNPTRSQSTNTDTERQAQMFLQPKRYKADTNSVAEAAPALTDADFDALSFKIMIFGKVFLLKISHSYH